MFYAQKIYDDIAKSYKTSTGKWVTIFPSDSNRYRLFDPTSEKELGHILFDEKDYWVYDGESLSITEQDEIAGAINGHEREMDELLRSLQED